MTANTLEQRARELLAAEYERADLAYAARCVRLGECLFGPDIASIERASLRAIEAALRLSAGADWVLVPRGPTPEMIEAAASFGGDGGYCARRGEEAAQSWRHMIAAATRHEPKDTTS